MRFVLLATVVPTKIHPYINFRRLDGIVLITINIITRTPFFFINSAHRIRMRILPTETSLDCCKRIFAENKHIYLLLRGTLIMSYGHSSQLITNKNWNLPTAPFITQLQYIIMFLVRRATCFHYHLVFLNTDIRLLYSSDLAQYKCTKKVRFFCV